MDEKKCDCSGDLRDRIVRLETNHDNLRESHNSSKNEFTDFKKEVFDKFDVLAAQINGIKLTLAKYMGIGIGVLFILELIIKVALK